jgi:hypothetical protein
MRIFAITAFATAALFAGQASATGLATCQSGPKSGWKPEADLQKKLIAQTWQPQEKLEKELTDKGWKIRRIKEDGGCYEVYAIDPNGKRIEAYFHPLTFDVVPTSKYP